MDQEVFNMSVRKFLKSVGVQSQREIEQAVAKGLADGTLKAGDSVPAKMTLNLEGLGAFTIEGKIDLG